MINDWFRFAVDQIEEPLSWRLQPQLHSPRWRNKKSALQLLHSGWGTSKWCYQPPEGITTRNHLFPITHHHHLPLLPPSMLNPEAITGFTRHLWTVFSFGCLGGHTRDPGTGQIQFTAARPMVMILTWRTVTGFIKSLIKMFSFTQIDY